MRFRSLMIVKCLVCLAFGPLLLLVPHQLLSVLGATFCAGAAVTTREYGAALIGNVFLTWSARGAEPSASRTSIILYLFVYDTAALVAMTIVQLQGAMNSLGWGIVAVYLFFAVTFGWTLLSQNSQAASI